MLRKQLKYLTSSLFILFSSCIQQYESIDNRINLMYRVNNIEFNDDVLTENEYIKQYLNKNNISDSNYFINKYTKYFNNFSIICKDSSLYVKVSNGRIYCNLDTTFDSDGLINSTKCYTVNDIGYYYGEIDITRINGNVYNFIVTDKSFSKGITFSVTIHFNIDSLIVKL